MVAVGSKRILKRLFLALHRVLIRIGIHVLPVHFYSPVPNILELSRTKDLWARRSEMPGVEMNVDRQVEMVRSACLPFRDEYKDNRAYLEAVHDKFGLGYGPIEAQVLHAVIRHFKPTRIVEVGGGVSTFCMAAASAINDRERGGSTKIVCLEPHPAPALHTIAGVEFVTTDLQRVDPDIFGQLGKNDLLFIDSSHAVKPGSDVNHLILEVLPRLATGIIVHFHDIFFPYDYQRDVLNAIFHWTETSLLHAFLINNARVEILFCLSILHYDRPEVLREIAPGYSPQPGDRGLLEGGLGMFEVTESHFPSSIYLRMK